MLNHHKHIKRSGLNLEKGSLQKMQISQDKNLDRICVHFAGEDYSVPEIPSSFKQKTNVQDSLSDNNTCWVKILILLYMLSPDPVSHSIFTS